MLTDTGLAHQMSDRVLEIRWSEVAGVLREPDGDLVIFGFDGTAISVGPGLYRHGQRLNDAVQSHVPAHLIYDDPDPDQDE